jgi:hypothetical protein
MHPKNKPPIFVPGEYQAEMERLTKAALMDVAWQFATNSIDDGKTTRIEPKDIMSEVRAVAAFIVTLREQD